MKRMKNAALAALVSSGAFAVEAVPAAGQASDTYAVQGATLHTVSHGTIENGTLAVVTTLVLGLVVLAGVRSGWIGGR